MKLPWPFAHFVSSLLCPREQGFDEVRTLFGQRGKGQFCDFCGYLLWTAPFRGVFRGGHSARIAKLHRKVSKIEACPPVQVGHQALGSKSPDIGRKMERNLSEDHFFCFSPDFGRKMGRNLSVTISNSDLCSSQIF